MFIPSKKDGLRGKTNTLVADRDCCRGRGDYKVAPILRAKVNVNQTPTATSCEDVSSYMKDTITHNSGDIFSLLNNAGGYYGNYGMLDNANDAYLVRQPGLYMFEPNFTFSATGLDSVTWNVVVNGNTLAETVLKFTASGVDIINLSAKGVISLEAGDLVRNIVEFTGAASADVLGRDQQYSGIFNLKKTV